MSTAVEIIAGTAVEIVIGAFALGLLYRVWGKVLPTPRKHRILPFQKGVLLKHDGSPVILNSGDHWINSKRSVLICDMRAKPFQIVAQDVSMRDGRAMRITLSLECRVSDPECFISQSSDPFGALYIEARKALYLAARDFDGFSLFTDPKIIVFRISELLMPSATHLGLETTQLSVSEILPIGWFRPDPPPELTYSDDILQ